MEDELIFILNTGELRDGGFEGSFNDFAEEIEDEGGVVSGDYDEEGTPIMSIYGIDTDKLNSMLSDYGVENPEEYTSEADEDFDFDSADDEKDIPEEPDDEEYDEDDDEIIEIDDDELDEDEEIDEDEELDEDDEIDEDEELDEEKTRIPYNSAETLRRKTRHSSVSNAWPHFRKTTDKPKKVNEGLFSKNDNVKEGEPANIRDLYFEKSLEEYFGHTPTKEELMRITIFDSRMISNKYRNDIKDLSDFEILFPNCEVISHDAFYNCESLKRIFLPTSLGEIGYAAFSRCQSLLFVKMPNVKIIRPYAFSECKNALIFSIPSSILSIGRAAFAECKQLETLKIDAQNVMIDSYIIYGCDNLKKVEYQGKIYSAEEFNKLFGIKKDRKIKNHDFDNEFVEIDENKNMKNNKLKGTQNLSEAVTIKILNEVKDKAIAKRILESVKADGIKREAEEKALLEAKKNMPFYGINVNGEPVNEMSVVQLKNLLIETKFNYKKYYKKYKSLNESEDQTAVKYGKVLRKQSKLIKLLESVINWKVTGKLNEDENPFGDTTDQTSDQASSSDNAEASVPIDDSKELGDQTATLTAIVFKVKNADDFIKTLTDNGIPEEALEKGESDVTSGSDEQAEQPDQTQQPEQGGAPAPEAAPAGGAPAPGGNPFESLTTRLSEKNALNEDENPFADEGGDDNPFGDNDQPADDSGVDPLATETHDNAEEGEEVRLVDTSYASKVQQILQDVYGYSKEEFEDKLGGQIQDEGAEETDDTEDVSNGSESAEDITSPENDEDDEKDGEEEEINPEDVFGDL